MIEPMAYNVLQYGVGYSSTSPDLSCYPVHVQFLGGTNSVIAFTLPDEWPGGRLYN